MGCNDMKINEDCATGFAVINSYRRALSSLKQCAAVSTVLAMKNRDRLIKQGLVFFFLELLSTSTKLASPRKECQ